ncbi:MAG: hypothetical protein M1819_005460 [Sarea resinae]|nr:MAG: hypothetical protein M1819_005460 [Sarea resinae]
MSSTPSQWHKDEFFISTSQAFLQLDVINKAFGSEFMYWTKAMPKDALKHMLSHSLCFGVYASPQSSSENAGRLSATQVGLARVITDESTFAYLTDVFILPEYQGHGLGKWMMECINETLDSWPDLRGAMLYTSGEHAQRFYRETLGMKAFVPGTSGLEIMNKKGPGSVFEDV